MASRNVETALMLAAVAQLSEHISASKRFLLDLADIHAADPDLRELALMTVATADMLSVCNIAIKRRSAGSLFLTMQAHEMAVVKSAAEVSETITSFLSLRAGIYESRVH